jgi:hypothetical protein
MDLSLLETQILKAIKVKEKREPTHTDFGVTLEQFNKAVFSLEDKSCISNVKKARGGDTTIIWLDDARITSFGEQILKFQEI